MTEKLVSILMPAYNCEKYIKLAIESILDQTHTNFELLIADDCSTDNTKAIIDSYDDIRIKRFHNASNLGYLQASNKLFSQCSGDYISFQDADDFSSKDRFINLINYLNDHPEVACVGSNIMKIDADGKEFFSSEYPLVDKEIRIGFLNHRVVMTGSALLIKKEVIKEVGFYNLYFDRMGSEDTYWYSLILDKYKVSNLNERLYHYRANPNSVGFTHKDPRAKVGHNLVVLMYKRRLLSKKDFIATKEWDKADASTKYLLAINKVKDSKMQAIIDFVKATFTAPSLVTQFFREFGSNLRAV